MDPHILRRTQILPAVRDEVFAFFEAPENLARITPPWLDFRILTPSPITLKEGTLIDYTVRWLGARVRWTTMITDYDPGVRFVDQQIRGPYSFWHHTHEFRDTEEGTVMDDTVRYAVPLGAMGNVLHGLLIRRQLDAIFDYRRTAIAQLFSATGLKALP